MAKSRVTFLCRSCGSTQPRWLGKCPDCGTWDSLERYVPPADTAPDAVGAVGQWAGSDEGGPALALPLTEVSTRETPRLPSGVGELDRVLGGGFVPGSAVLLGGDPGIGKSTLLLQAAARVADRNIPVLYVSSEESVQQVKLRAERVLADEDAATAASGRGERLYVLSETNLARIVEQVKRLRPALLVVDSIQMLWTSGVEAAPGSATQLRRACLDLVALAKSLGITVAVVGHVTKEGELAGPKLLEHLVDVVLHFEGDRQYAHRVVRAIKNRFGSTHEIGLFEMTGGGLSEVREGSLALPDAPVRPGTAFVPSIAGSRCLVAEVQALTSSGFLGNAKRRTSGLDSNRLAMLIAVLEKHGGLRLADQDVFAQVAGGVRVVEPAADLAIALAIAGAHYGRSLPCGAAVVGEIGLTGEVRAARSVEQRAAEVARRGGRTIVVPAGQVDAARRATLIVGVESVSVVGAASVAQGLELLECSPSGTQGASRGQRAKR